MTQWTVTWVCSSCDGFFHTTTPLRAKLKLTLFCASRTYTAATAWARRTRSHQQVMHHNMSQENTVSWASHAPWHQPGRQGLISRSCNVTSARRTWSHEQITVRRKGSCSWTHSLHFYMCSHKKHFLLFTFQPQWLWKQQSQFPFQHSSLPPSPVPWFWLPTFLFTILLTRFLTLITWMSPWICSFNPDNRGSSITLVSTYKTT